MPHLFEPYRIRDVVFKNRAWMSPMCQYSALDGVPNDWHFVHLGSRAVGGAGLVLAEATGIEPEGRITPGCTGLWNGEQAEAWSKIVRFVESRGAVPGIQLGHAGRKASSHVPWSAERGGVPLAEGGWVPKSVGTAKFLPSHNEPTELGESEISELVAKWAHSAELALVAGFKVVEIHGAHGYLLHQFYSPLSNTRCDGYGGSYDNRVRFLMEVVRAVRGVWPERLPLFVRLSTTDWVEGGWTVDDSVELARRCKEEGVDLIDCSSGGATPDAQIPYGPGYQVPNARKIRHEAGIATGAVGGISSGSQAEEILESGSADAVLLAKAMLDDPYWAIHAAREIGAGDLRGREYSWVKLG